MYSPAELMGQKRHKMLSKPLKSCYFGCIKIFLLGYEKWCKNINFQLWSFCAIKQSWSETLEDLTLCGCGVNWGAQCGGASFNGSQRTQRRCELWNGSSIRGLSPFSFPPWGPLAFYCPNESAHNQTRTQRWPTIHIFSSLHGHILLFPLYTSSCYYRIFN